MEISMLQQQVDEWIKKHGVRYFNELTNMAILTEEVGEVARIIARRYGEQSEKESDKTKVLGEELADVLFVLVCLANQTGVDLEKAMAENLKKKTQRDIDRHKNNPKLLDWGGFLRVYVRLKQKLFIEFWLLGVKKNKELFLELYGKLFFKKPLFINN